MSFRGNDMSVDMVVANNNTMAHVMSHERSMVQGDVLAPDVWREC